MAADDAGVVVPPELAGLVGRLLAYGLDALAARNGGLPPVPGLVALRTQLGAAAMSARGRPGRMLVPPARGAADTLTTREAAEVMGVSERHVRRLAAEGVLIARRDGRDWRIDAGSAHDGRRSTWQQEAA